MPGLVRCRSVVPILHALFDSNWRDRRVVVDFGDLRPLRSQLVRRGRTAMGSRYG